MKAQCTVGEGPDVIISMEGTPFILLEPPSTDKCHSEFGACRKGDIDLNLKEAEEFLDSLQAAVLTAKEFYESYDEYCKQKLKKEEERRHDNPFPNISGIGQS